jgi:hypothetical protein
VSARVVRIFDRRRLAINLGTADGVQLKEKLLIYTPEADIVDPESGESLGVYRRLKATVFVAEVFEKFCVARPPQEREEVAIPSASDTIYSMFSKRTTTRLVPGQLDVANNEVEPLPTGHEIHVGDFVERAPVTVAQE